MSNVHHIEKEMTKNFQIKTQVKKTKVNSLSGSKLIKGYSM